jgi:phage-related protein
MMNGLIGDISFKNKLLSDFGVFPDFSKAFNTPEYAVNPISIPGRNGDLIVPGYRYSNRKLTIKCFIKKDFVRNYRDLVDFLTASSGSYERLELTAEPDTYQMAAFYAAVVPDTGPFLRWGRFDLIFDCMPQKFLKSGDIPIYMGEASTAIAVNPTLKPARPLIEVNYVADQENGGQIEIGNAVINIAYTPYAFFIDCDQMRAYRLSNGAAIAMDPYVTMPDDYVELGPGETAMSSLNVDCNIFPRWWRL